MWFLPVSVVVFTTIVAIPLSRYMAWIMDGKYRPPRWLRWFEERIGTGPQTWTQYAAALLVFNGVLFVFGFVVLSLQPWLPLNPEHKGMLSPSTIFDTVVSFMTNTNIQHYSGEVHFSNFSQIFFCICNFFLSAAVGLSAFAALIRAITGRVRQAGNERLKLLPDLIRPLVVQADREPGQDGGDAERVIGVVLPGPPGDGFHDA